jgi:hypothetical protein
MRFARQVRDDAAAVRESETRQADNKSSSAESERCGAEASVGAETKRRENAEQAERELRTRREAEEATRRAEAERMAAELAKNKNPPPGYRFEEGRLVWIPGMRHPQAAHVFASEKEKAWSTDEGYDWVDRDSDSLDVVWKPGVMLSKTRRTGENEGQIEEWNRCGRCNGSGKISRNVQNHCERCDGTGKMDCLFTEVNGGSCRRHVCNFCEGRKGVLSFGMFTPCTSCFGTGVQACTQCRGTGKMPCSNCFGTGGRQTQRVDEECSACDGDGGEWVAR